MSTPPVKTTQQSQVPILSTVPQTNSADEKTSAPATPSTPNPPVMAFNPAAPQPQWLTQWHTNMPTDVESTASSSVASFPANSSSMALVPRQTDGTPIMDLCLESLPPEALCQVFIQLQKPRLFNSSLSNLAMTSKTMHANVISFIEKDRAGRTYATMRQWQKNIQAVRKNCSDEKFELNNRYLLQFLGQENVEQRMQASGFKLKNMAFDFSIGQHWTFQMEILTKMKDSFVKIDASSVGLSALIDEIFPTLANASDSNVLILDLSSNALSASDALELLKMIDKKNNVYQINLSNNPDFANDAAETKEFFNFLFGKSRPLSHLRLNNTGLNDACVLAICGAIQHPHLLQMIEIANHTASDGQLQVLKKSVQKHTAQLRYFEVDKTSIYSTSAIGILSDSIDIDWGKIEQDYDDLTKEFYDNPNKSYFDPTAARLRHHPIRQLHERAHYEPNSDDEYEFDHSLPTD